MATATGATRARGPAAGSNRSSRFPRMTYPPAPTRTPRRIKQMRPDEVASAIRSDPRLIIPAGTCEQHGRHMPLGADTMIVEHLADDLSAEFGVCVAPTLEYGVNVATERGFPGNASLRKKTLHRMLNDLLDTWESTGVRVVDIFAIDFRELLEGQTAPMHGDELDTSLMLYLAPQLVQMDLAEDYMMSREELRRYRRGWLKVPKGSSGTIGRPSLASPAKGAAIYARIREKVRARVFLTPEPDTD